ncbi:integrase core domain-containing protein [Ferruginibacter sp.]
MRKELLNVYVSTILEEVLEKAEQWRQDYNCSRPHQSLGFVPPAEFI